MVEYSEDQKIGHWYPCYEEYRNIPHNLEDKINEIIDKVNSILSEIEKMKNIDIFVKSYDVDVLKREFDKYWKGYTT